MTDSKRENGFVHFIKGIMDLFIKDGKFSFSNFIITMFLILGCILYTNREEFMDYVLKMKQNSSVAVYIDEVNGQMKMDYEASLVNQSQIIYSIYQPDTVAVYMYKPEDLHYFKEIVHYEGKLPSKTEKSDFKKIGIDKFSEEYQRHIGGLCYETKGLVEYDHIPGVSRFYVSCPVFNRRSMYVGYVGTYWDSVPDIQAIDKLLSMNIQSARVIGSFIQ